MLTARGISAPVVRPMKREKQSKHLSSHVTTEVAIAKTNLPSIGK
jgi:hypothetical protein